MINRTGVDRGVEEKRSAIQRSQDSKMVQDESAVERKGHLDRKQGQEERGP